MIEFLKYLNYLLFVYVITLTVKYKIHCLPVYSYCLSKLDQRRFLKTIQYIEEHGHNNNIT